MSVAVPPPVSAPARAGRGLQAAGVVLLVAAAVAGVVAVVAFVQRLTGAEPTSIGEGVVLQVEAGEELAIYGRSRLDSGEGCVVDGPDGAPLPSQAVRHTETLTFNDRSYVLLRTVTTLVTGPHEVTCPLGGFAVGPRVAVLGTIGLVFGGVFGGAVLAVVGLILLVVGTGRRRRARAATPWAGSGWPQGGPQAAWPGAPPAAWSGTPVQVPPPAPPSQDWHPPPGG